MGFGLLKPKHKTLGADVAGQIEAIGTNATWFQPGDEVFGGLSGCSFDEYVCASENILASKPVDVSFEEAAAAPWRRSPPCRILAIEDGFSPGKRL